jgi:hypothetical protein
LDKIFACDVCKNSEYLPNYIGGFVKVNFLQKYIEPPSWIIFCQTKRFLVKGGSKLKYAKIDQACSLKSLKKCGHSLEATFVRRFFKTSRIQTLEKLPKIQYFQFSIDYSK